MRRSIWVLLALTVALAACASRQYTAWNRRPVNPWAEWVLIAQEVEGCTGRTVPFADVEWFRADSITRPGWLRGVERYDGLHARGIGWRHIILVHNAPDLVRHELLHAAGLDHEDEDFKRCLR